MNTDVLKKNILFKNLTSEEAEAALKVLSAKEKKYKKGTTILYAGTKTDDIGIVLSGSVTIESNDMWGNRTILNNIGEGDFFAETYAILPQESLLVDAVANEDSTILFLNIGNLVRELPLNEPWRVKLIKSLLMISSRKNLMLSGRSFHTSPKTVRGRIEAYLNSVSLKKGTREFDIPFDRQQMADYLNLDRTALSKELGKMKKEGIIDFKKNHFRIELYS